jgi:1-aminocyclopropane-1-carboxylate deaminase
LEIQNKLIDISFILDDNTSDIKLFVFLDYLTHPTIQGNKWRKLQYNIEDAQQRGFNTIASFGGAYSNHLYALAAAGKHFGFNTIGYIRGEEVMDNNPTLEFLRSNEMELIPLTREEYRNYKNDFSALAIQNPSYYFLAEGGTNELALKGFRHLIEDINIDYDVLVCPVGSGGTVAGLSMYSDNKVIGIPAVKDASLNKKIFSLSQKEVELNFEYTFGGFGNVNHKLVSFINKFTSLTKIPLDPIYTGKMMYGILDMISQNKFASKTKIIAIHTGGQQGIVGHNSKYIEDNEMIIY